MSALPSALYTTSGLRELEHRAMESARVAAGELMRRAGAAAWEFLAVQWPEARELVVLCGAGNNAGDGYVLASQALSARRSVTVLTVGDPARLPAIAADARRAYLQAAGSERTFDGSLPTADLLIDAVLGIGLDRPLTGKFLQAVEAMNRSHVPVLALDIPTGLDADSGAIMGAAVHAAATITFIGLKLGLCTGAGPEYAGFLRFTDLDAPASIYGRVPMRARRLLPTDAQLPRRRRDAHKGDFGHVLVVGGDLGMGGAARLAAEAALRTGAGLVSVATRAAHVPALLAGLPEAMVRGVENAQDLSPLLSRATVVAIGPGLGQDEWGRGLLARVLECAQPLVVDADALNLLAPQKKSRSRGRWILTPHPGEAARLLGTDTATVQADRCHSAEQLASAYQAVTVLKGAGTLVAAPPEITAVCSAGNPGMAAPGMGDVLTGVIAALLAQDLSPPEAAYAGVYLHASAGDIAARLGERGLMARDLLDTLRRVVNG
jgi:hydroxyethylthiazole kinase-like uncharacterized protein yjeF